MKKNLIAISVMSAMSASYRRAEIAFVPGENDCEVTKEQFEAIDADKNLTITITNADSIESSFESKTCDFDLLQSHNLLAKENTFLEDEKNALNSKVTELTELCTKQQDDILELEEQLKIALLAAQPSKLNVVETAGLNVSSAPHELHHWIAVIDDLNEEAPLTKKPNCDLLTITVDDNSVTPTAAQRDDAWAWYQDNVVHTELISSEKSESE